MSGFQVSAQEGRQKTLGTLTLALEGDAARLGAARGMNEHARMQERNIRISLSAQTGINQGRVGKGIRLISANPGNLTAIIQDTDTAIPAGQYTSRSWSRSMEGARHGDWPAFSGRGGIMAHTFTVNKYGGAIFQRIPGQSGRAIRKVWGPILPNEMVRENMPTYPAAERFAGADLESRVLRQIALALGLG